MRNTVQKSGLASSKEAAAIFTVFPTAFAAMPDMPPFLVALLILMATCLVASTVAFVLMAYDIRRMARRLNAVLPKAAHVVRQADYIMRIVGRMARRMESTTESVEAVVAKLCGSVVETIEQFQALKGQARRSFGKWIGSNGHGTRAESRPHHRRRM